MIEGFELKLDFPQEQVDELHVVTIQGKKGCKRSAEKIKHELGMSWPNFLLQKLEQHAKKMGFEKIKIVNPELLEYYKHPFEMVLPPKIAREVEERMIYLRSRIREIKRYQLRKEEILMLRNLGLEVKKGEIIFNSVWPNKAQTWQAFELDLKTEYTHKIIRDRIKDFYYRIAYANDYKKEGDWFVKEL